MNGHTCPSDAAEQSVLVVQPHPNALHAEPLALPVQSLSDTQLTQEWVVVSHAIL
jgi:hypothetical protein